MSRGRCSCVNGFCTTVVNVKQLFLFNYDSTLKLLHFLKNNTLHFYFSCGNTIKDCVLMNGIEDVVTVFQVTPLTALSVFQTSIYVLALSTVFPWRESVTPWWTVKTMAPTREPIVVGAGHGDLGTYGLSWGSWSRWVIILDILG